MTLRTRTLCLRSKTVTDCRVRFVHGKGASPWLLRSSSMSAGSSWEQRLRWRVQGLLGGGMEIIMPVKHKGPEQDWAGRAADCDEDLTKPWPDQWATLQQRLPIRVLCWLEWPKSPWLELPGKSVTMVPELRQDLSFFFFFFGGKESLLYFGCWQPEEGWVREICLSKGWLPRTDNQWQQLLKTERGLHAETAESALIVILKLFISGLTSVILVALGAVNLQFQGQFVSTSLRQILELWQLILWVQSGHHIVNFFHLVGISVSTR